ncbi:hypothetical protein BpHYR1_051889 [Brachionus plicatilis]|uniref:Uncharacterized protein n=1 Tax=Brachionus plicatilis TaxID=10195 RepID=A0A3M7RLU0_BRAPC|nr:hypothetical protein BpHYR1_051889 [Brachionus plicatilis]
MGVHGKAAFGAKAACLALAVGVSEAFVSLVQFLYDLGVVLFCRVVILGDMRQAKFETELVDKGLMGLHCTKVVLVLWQSVDDK